MQLPCGRIPVFRTKPNSDRGEKSRPGSRGPWVGAAHSMRASAQVTAHERPRRRATVFRSVLVLVEFLPDARLLGLLPIVRAQFASMLARSGLSSASAPLISHPQWLSDGDACGAKGRLIRCIVPT